MQNISMIRIDINSWIFETSEKRMLLDPWLTPVASMPPVIYMQRLDSVPEHLSVKNLGTLDAIIITHQDIDHCDPKTLKAINKDVLAIGPKKVCKVLRKQKFNNIQQIDTWNSFDCGDVKITAVPGAHPKFTEINGYIFESNGITIYFAGDTQLIPEMEQISEKFKIDVALIPIIGVIFPFFGQVTMGPYEAVKLLKKLDCQSMMPNSYGNIKISGIAGRLAKTVGTLEQFIELASHELPDLEIILPERGETISL